MIEKLRRKIYSALRLALRNERTRQLNNENKLRVYDLEVTVSWDDENVPTVHCEWSSGEIVQEYAGDATAKGVREVSEVVRKAVFEILTSCVKNIREEKDFRKRIMGLVRIE